MNIRFKASAKEAKAGLNAAVCFEDGGFSGLRLDRSKKNKLTKYLKKARFTGKAGETCSVPPSESGTGGVLFLIGLGKEKDFTLEKARRAVPRLLSHAKAERIETVSLDIDSFSSSFSAANLVGAVVEGARLSEYRFDKYKTKPASSAKVADFYLISKEGGAVRNAIAEAEIVSGGVIFARDLANEPANVMTPSRLAKAAREMAAKNGLSCKVLGRAEMKRLGMGGVLGVSQGSAEEPQFIILENRPANPRFKEPIVLVGKGVTFDTGGISIKPSGDMDKMKFDMCGAAAVIGAMKAVSNLKLRVKVVGITPVCENMPGSKAQRPGDIIKIMNGKTVEVLNTDAEGRLILEDALSYAERYKPKALIDIATLTGACAATFSDLAIGLMGTDKNLVERIQKAGEYTGERSWELPLWEEYAALIRGNYGDIQNISRKSAGTITAGMFLKEFASHTSAWAHLDVAGTAWTDGPKPLSPIGATGVGVRLFVRLVQDYLK